MGSKKRPSSSVEEVGGEENAPVEVVTPEFVTEPKKGRILDEKTEAEGASSSAIPLSLKPMERKKKRKLMDKERHRLDSENKLMDKERHRLDSENKEQSKDQKSSDCPAKDQTSSPSLSSINLPGFHIDVFRDLSSLDSSVREVAAQKLVAELRDVQKAYEKLENKKEGNGAVQLEAEKDDGMEHCAPTLRYAIRRLIRGVSSSRECARQGFALGLTAVVGSIHTVEVESVMKLIVDLLEISSSMKGQEARDCLLGRLFAYGSLARSGRIATEWILDNSTSLVKDFTSQVISLAGKKRYLSEPAIAVILEMVEKLPVEALLSQVLKAPGMHEWFEKAAEVGDPDALFLALKLQQRVHDSEVFGKLLPYPFSHDNFCTRDHLLYLAPCFKESTFCMPRLHSLWPLVANLLIPESASQDEDAAAHSGKKHKKSRKGNSFGDVAKNICSFCEVVVEGSLLSSSHERKHLALSVLLLLLPRLAVSCIQVVLSNKLVHCLMDVLSNKGSWLYNAAQLFLKELLNWVGDDDDRRVAVIVSLQKHSNGKFDSITRTQAVKELVTKFNTGPGCLLFVHNLISLFVDEGTLTDEPSDQSQTTDENSEMGSTEDKEPPASGNTDFLKNWLIDTMPRVLKNLKLDSNAKSLFHTEKEKFIEEKFRVQTEIMKFLAVQGLFSSSLGTEVTSFELQEKFKWPKASTSSSLCRMCIEQLQLLLEDAQKGEGSHLPSGLELNDLGSYFMCFLNTMCNIPSVSLYRTLSKEDERAFKKLQAMDSKLSHEERRIRPEPDANKLHAVRYLLIQLLLQVLLHPGEFSEAALELNICCKKAFHVAAHGDSSEEEDQFDDNEAPEMMDVLVDTLLSLLPQSSGPICFAVEQVFRFFCDGITDAGLLQMLRVVKKDLKPRRHQAASSDGDEDDDDFLGIEEAEETDEAEVVETGDSDDHADDSEGMLGAEASDEEVTKNDDEDTERIDGAEATNEEVTKNDKDLSASDDSDSGMDDDAMFRMDSYIARIFKERKISGSDSAQSQLTPFKLRVLSLLEIYLQKNPGKPQVLMVYSYLVQAFVNSHSTEGGEQVRQRIGGILQKKIFKAKDYPKGDDIQLGNLSILLEKSLKSASRSRYKTVSSLAQTSSFWILKIIHSRKFSKSELEGVVNIFRNILVDYFHSKKSRLKPGFVKEVIRRHPWLGLQLFHFLLEKCGSAKSEFRRVEMLDLIDCIMKSYISTGKAEKDNDSSSKSKLLKRHLHALCELIQELLSNLPEKQSRRVEVRRFCTRVLHAVSTLSLNKSFLKALKPETYFLCESQLGDAFLPFKMPTK
ncbi:rDNA transcriptional regulator pol5-like [Phoenix dactylifera]|uniref:rDNA transcriptional regulator pol5-like n=1 Tax=Phoenix dactylifera TaxID=42345 RepID=A0A8B8IXQ3_PHODC|nr:rDNA transcriptional regulator pol5-like [Phoenix dactylifera]XP_026655725.2 rDNA transcriptional regulator pol5-like [Phoenix dactylifera]XP_026655726.2 rDNA transcriptional regulator pol5-like [Phoenix dactylifera]